MTIQPLEILQKFWDYDNFRHPQQEIIQSILDGHDTFALLPTGGGKSITFQVPAIMLGGICLVISPLIALMKDQITNLKEKGVKAEFISSELTYTEIEIILDNCRFGNVKLLYVSPERMQSNQFVESLKTLNVSFVAIDEAHCISEWGHDFRPAYLELKTIKELFPQKPILALTATATSYIQEEILKELHLENPRIFKKTIERKNLAYRIYKSEDKLMDLVQLLRHYKGSAIIFCRTRKETYEVSTFLKEHGFNAEFYHARLSPEEKTKRQKAFLASDNQILASTNAFGMGIDKPDIRTVFHLSAPDSMESYIQEVGRAGRDGLDARGVLLYNPIDKKDAFKSFRQNLPKKNEFLEIIRKLYNYFQIGDHEMAQGQKAFSERKFREQYGFSKQKVRKVLQFLTQQKVIDIQHSQHASLVKILIENRNFQDENHAKGKVLSYLARNYSGIFVEPKPIDEVLIARKLKMSKINVKEKLNELQDSEIIFYRDASIIKISFLEPRDDNQAKVDLYKKFEQLQRIKWQRLNAMYFFIEDENRCKSVMLLKYFGEKSTSKCGICSYCQPQISKEKLHPNRILEYLNKNQKTNDEIFAYFAKYDKNEIIKNLQYLMDEEKIRFILPNIYSL